MDKRTIFEKCHKNKESSYIDCEPILSKELKALIPEKFLRNNLPLPDLGELDIVRHYAYLESLNFSVDANFYPLGSCTMKYNPKINEEVANLNGFTDIHPYQSQEDIQGAIELMYCLEKALCEITGMERFSLQPSSGAQGEFAGMLMVRKFHQVNGNKKTKVIVPDTAHGTNPASAAMSGYKIQVIKSNAKGLVDVEQLRSLVDEETAAIMLTNPNTLGLFEERILEISDIIHQKGGLLYYDGANFNPLLGITNPMLMGFDIVHLNLHKTFSTPHGCGGPGAGVVGVSKRLVDFLPVPLIEKQNGKFYFNYNLKYSVGRLRSFYGNFSVLVRTYAYILRLGKNGLFKAAQNAVLNANYLKQKLEQSFKVAYSEECMHEVIFTCQQQKEDGASAFDIAKRLIDYKVHPPTIYFPLIVKEALMIEPTETESKETIDKFIEIMIKINNEIKENLQIIKNSPHNAPVKRVDEIKAARCLNLAWKKTGD